MGKRSSFERRSSDKYLTPYAAVIGLIPHLRGVHTFVEPCAGDRRLVHHLERHGLECVLSMDIEPDSLFVGVGDALELTPSPHPVITNPPWDRKLLHPMIERFVASAPFAWLLFDADWCHTAQSKPFMRYLTDIVPIGRVRWIEGSTMSGKDNCAWHRFSRDCDGLTKFHSR